jgi:hypothetical protein
MTPHQRHLFASLTWQARIMTMQGMVAGLDNELNAIITCDDLIEMIRLHQRAILERIGGGGSGGGPNGGG